MAYRNGTYVAFNGMGTTNPTESDMKYYGLLQRWGNEKHADFQFSDSHKKTYSVYDTSSKETLKARLMERFRSSKNMLLVITDNSVINRGMLNWEIEKAVDTYKIPIIVAYTGYKSILHPRTHSEKWPDALRVRIENGTAKAIHIAFKKDAIGSAISQFSINREMPSNGYNYYSKELYDRWNK